MALQRSGRPYQHCFHESDAWHVQEWVTPKLRCEKRKTAAQGSHEAA
jgi:hypothetical protein